MPKREGKILCVNHPESAMHRVEGAFTLTKPNPAPNDLVPTQEVRLYRCLQCGYIELYEHKSLADDLFGPVGKKEKK